MARPQNPLDQFVTYTYHFELHAHIDWDVLKNLDRSDANATTTRTQPNDTLLINTRRDAHQVIDDVKYTATCNMTSRSMVLASLGDCELTVTEPGGFGFIEKLNTLRTMYDVKDMASLIFVLKPIFVGRLPDNSIVTLYSNLIPGTLVDLSARVDHRGSVYNMRFVIENSVGTARGGPRGAQMNFAFTDKNISFEASTVQEALQKLQTSLQKNYDDTYKNRLDDNGARRIKYTIKFDEEIKGDLDMLLKNSFAREDVRKLTFDCKKEISEFIYDILTRSSDINKKVGDTHDVYRKQLHEGAWMPVVVGRVYKKAREVEVIFDIKIYRGGKRDEFEFDYYFAGAGKNVDIIEYEVVFPTLINWLATNDDFGTDYNTNMSATLPTYNQKAYTEDSLHQDITREKIYSLASKQTKIDGQKGDIAYLAAAPLLEHMGVNMMEVKDVPSMRLAYNSLAKFRGSIHPQQTMVIRGHKGLLDLCTPYPDGSDDMFNTEGGCWIKVNTYMIENGMRKQFYYTGWYLLFTVTNQFTGGKFLQHMTLSYKDDESGSSGSSLPSSASIPVSNWTNE